MTNPDTPSRPEALPRRLLALRVFLPFAAGFFLSYLYRTVNAVIAPDIAADTGLSAADIGLLTSMYFLSFAAFQLPLGMLLDRFGPRRVEASLLLIAALGAILFALLDSLAGLALGRALIGIGVSCCLMAGFKAFVLWFPNERIPAINGFMMTFGGLGALVSTMPVELLLNFIGWRDLFLGLGGLTALLAMAIFLIVPEHRGPVADTVMRDQIAGLREIFRDRFFWRISPTAAITIGVSLSIQSLWAGPWLRDVQGLEPIAVASHLMLAAGIMSLSYPVIGLLAQQAARLRITTVTVAGIGMTCFMLVIVAMAVVSITHDWAIMGAFGFFAAFTSLNYALLGQHFPARLVGRASTALNMLAFATAFAMQWGTGAIIGYWIDPATGHYDAMGYRVGFGLLAVLQVLAILWFFIFSKCLGQDDGSEPTSESIRCRSSPNECSPPD